MLKFKKLVNNDYVIKDLDDIAIREEDIVIKAIQSTIGKFCKTDIHELIPSVNEKSLERYIKILCDLKEIEKHR